MRIVVALGGNALLRRGEPMTADQQRRNVHEACAHLARIQPGNDLVIAHGNGPQVGLLALQAAAYAPVTPYPLDVLGAESEGMIGYLIEQELGNLLPGTVPLATLLTQVQVDPEDPAFSNPTKPIGPVYSKEEADHLATSRGWHIAADGDRFRRVVPSPRPQKILELRPIRWLLDKGTVLICAGGGGVPTRFSNAGQWEGVEAVIDKDLCASLLARELDADILIIATDVDGIYRNWGKPDQQRLDRVKVDEIDPGDFPAGSMGPKVQAALEFVRATGRPAVIGALGGIDDMLAGRAGTRIER